MGRVAAALLALCVLAGSAEAETVLRARINSDIVSNDPGTKRDENTDAVILHVVEGLVGLREDGSVGPLLAKDWTVEGNLYRFTLRDGVTFHNGKPLTAAEVVWSLKRYLDPATHWRCKPELIDGGVAKVVELSAPDPRTVLVRLDRPAPLFLKTMARPDCGGTGILHPDSVNADGSWRAPIGTGPFQWSVWRRNQFIELQRFAGYQPLPGPKDGNVGGKRALVDRVRIMVIPDASSAIAALLRGNIDILDGLSPSELSSVKNRPDIRLESSPTMDFYAVLIQSKDPVMSDVRLRRAIALCIDSAGLTKAVSWGTAQADNSPIPASSPFHGAAETPLRLPDLGLARQLVKQSGYKGETIHLITNRRYTQMFDTAVLVQAMAAQAGIKIEIETLDWATQYDYYASGNYQAMIFAFSALMDPTLNFGRLIGAEPRKVWHSPHAGDLLRQSAETEGAARQAVFDQLNAAFMDEVPAIALFNSARIAGVRGNVAGFANWPAAQMRLWGVGLD